MALVVELFSGRSEIVADKSSAEIPYIVLDASNEDEVKLAVLASVPVVYAGMPLISYEISERINSTTWKVVARFQTDEYSDDVEEPEPIFSFDTGGGQQHITQSLATPGRYGPEVAWDSSGAIGFDGESIAGVDITVPIYNFSETHYLPAEVVTSGFRLKLFLATGTVNTEAFKGFSAGEVLFLGASGSRRGTDPANEWEVTFNFAAQKNRDDIQVGDIGPIEKLGWHYMWVQYSPDLDDSNMVMIKKAVAVYVEQVYQTSNFANLGIGVE